MCPTGRTLWTCSGSSRTSGHSMIALCIDIVMFVFYSNIQMEEGLVTARKALETQKDKSVPDFFILQLLDLLLKYNIFEFDDEPYQQLVSTAIGNWAAPNIAEFSMRFMDDDIACIRAQSLAVNVFSPLGLYK